MKHSNFIYATYKDTYRSLPSGVLSDYEDLTLSLQFRVRYSLVVKAAERKRLLGGSEFLPV